MSSENQIKNIINQVTKNINEDMKDFIPLKTICEKYKKQPSHIVMIIGAVMFVFTALGLFEHVFVTIFGFLYPAYMSYKAIQEQSEMASTVWLTYWIIFGFFTAFDKLLGVILFFIPGYYLLKAIFYTWMFYPRTKGAQVIYENFLKPQLLKLRDLAHKKND